MMQFLLALAPLLGLASAEDLAIESAYPAPIGVYRNFTATGRSILARDGGRVFIGPKLPSAFGPDNQTLLQMNVEHEHSITVAGYSNAPDVSPVIQGTRSRGTLAAPAPVQDGDTLLEFVAYGFNGGPGRGYHRAASIAAVVDGPVGPGSVPARWEFSATPDLCVWPCVPPVTMTVKSDGRIGIGTATPQARLHVVDVGGRVVQLDGGWAARMRLIANPSSPNADGWDVRMQGGGLIAATYGAAGASGLKLTADGRIYIGRNITPAVPAVGRKIDTDIPGAYMDLAGVWQSPSSRGQKEDIRPLESAEAAAAFEKLRAAVFEYKSDPGRRRLGFIAEEAPEVVATPSRDGIHPLAVAAVLTKIVQDQQELIEAGERELRELEESLDRLER